MQQITLNFEEGLTEAYNSCREFVAARVHHQGRSQKSIAADMDYSPSTLTRKLAQSENDSLRFTLDDLELLIRITGDTQPILYLVEKYLVESEDEIEALERKLALMKQSRKIKAVD